MDKFGARRREVLSRLRAAGGLSEAAVRAVHEATGVPEADIWGAGSFYDLLRMEPGDASPLRVCRGLTCHLAGATALAGGDASCLGQCDRAPVALGGDGGIAVAGPRGGVSHADLLLPMNLGGDDVSAYAALARARQLGPEAVLAELDAAGLQGRGGAGFPAGVKWRAVASQADQVRYVVCNADEGEPGTFKDREVLLRRPHLLLEGLAIAAEAVGAADVFVYIRGEFLAERASLSTALTQAADTLSHLAWHLVDGHGAYICGEETALIASIEGERGMPRLKPPYPTSAGLWGRPTLMNNVETLACVPDIVLRGGARFRDLGRTEPGTKLYCASGHVRRPGVYELPLGVTVDEVIAAAGGAVGEPMAFSPGGASSGFLPMSLRDTPLDFTHLAAVGSMLGSAGVVLLNDTVDLAEAALVQARFFEHESCGQCAPCRIGTQLVRQAVQRFVQTGDRAHLDHVDAVANEMVEGSICGLGMVAAAPIQSAREHFPARFGQG